jgi:hypothetical protein
LLPLVQLKHEEEFTWGGRTARTIREDQRIPRVSTHATSSKARESIQHVYCRSRMGYWSFLLQEEDGKEFSVGHVSRRLLDTKTRYVFMEKLCLSLYYACSKFRHYILSSTCIVACQYDVIKHMLLKPILSGRIGKWDYVLVEYDLAYKLLRSMKGK